MEINPGLMCLSLVQKQAEILRQAADSWSQWRSVETQYGLVNRVKLLISLRERLGGGCDWENDCTNERGIERTGGRWKNAAEMVGGRERRTRESGRVDRPGLTVGCASLIPVYFQSKHTCPSILTPPFTNTFPPGRVRPQWEAILSPFFVLIMQIVSEKGCAVERICSCTPFSSSLSLCLTKVNLNMCVSGCVCVRAHMGWHTFAVLFNVYWHRCMQQLWPPLWWCQIRKFAEWEGTWWKESGRARKGECFTSNIWSQWTTHGGVPGTKL